MRILDAATGDGTPWYAMELLSGPTLGAAARELVRRTGRVPAGVDFFAGEATVATLADSPAGVPRPVGERPCAGGGALPELMALLGRLAEPLAHIHGEGLVHRDVKPGNVLVTDDGRLVLLDFGLTTFHPGAEAREVLQAVGLGVGTAAYMAPEQARGELVDARADIYALGCIGYELVTGHPPLVGPTAWATLARRQREQPAPPSDFVTGIPSGLEDLLLEMLAPAPEDRMGHAEDVRARLVDLGLAPAAPVARGRAYLYRPRLTGRDGVLEALASHLDAAREGRGGLLLLGGEAGIGKTRLAMSLAERARAAGAWVADCDCGMDGDASPSRALVRRIAESCREGGLAATRRILSPSGRALAHVAGEIRDVPGATALPPVTVPPGAGGKALISVAITDAVLAVSEGSPVLVVIDDLPLGDETLVAWLSHLGRTRRLDDSRALVLATHRVEERHAVVEELAAAGVTRLQAPPLDDASVSSMARDMLALEPPPELVDGLAARAEGNPLFVAEYLRTAVEEGLLTRDPVSGWRVVSGATAGGLAGLATPRALAQLLSRHAALLPPLAREVLVAAAVLGRTVDESVLARTVPLADGERLDAIQTLIARAFLEPGAGGVLRFRHDGTRRVVYDTLAGPERRTRHAAAAQAMAAAGSGPTEALAVHRRLGGDEAAAGTTYLEAARAAAARFELEAAGRCYRAALDLAEMAELDRLAIVIPLVEDVLVPLGRLDEAAGLVEQALARPWPDPSARARALLMLSMLHLELDRHAEARRIGGDALREFRVLGDRAEESRALAGLALVHARGGDVGEAARLGEAAVALLPHVRDPLRRGETMVLVGNLCWKRGRLPAARAHYARAAEAFASAGEVRSRAMAMVNLGGVEGLMGEDPIAAAHLAEAVELLRRIGDRLALGTALLNLGSVLRKQGHVDEALATYQEATPLLRDTGNRVDEALAWSRTGELLALGGRTAEAPSCFAAAVRVLEGLDDPGDVGVALSTLAECMASAGGDAARAAELSRRGIALLSDHGAPADLAMALCREGHLGLARGEDAGPLLRRIDRVLEDAGVVPAADLAGAIERLRDASRASR